MTWSHLMFRDISYDDILKETRILRGGGQIEMFKDIEGS